MIGNKARRDGVESGWLVVIVAKRGKSVAERSVVVWRHNVREIITMNAEWMIHDARVHRIGTSKWNGAG